MVQSPPLSPAEPAGPATSAGRSAGAGAARLVVARHTFRRTLRSAVVWGYVFGVVIASSAISYPRIYKTATDRARLAASFGANHAASALFGPAPGLQTVAGFTAFKSSMTLILIAAIWGLLTSTKCLRGEEEAGRWELLLGGRATAPGATAQALAGVGGAVVVVWALTGLVTVVAGRSSQVRIGVGAALFMALAMVASAVVFLGVGAVTSQLFPTRRQARGWAAAVLAVAYGLRMVGDAGSGLHWLVWLSPLGWVEELRPLVAPTPWVLGPIAGAGAGLAVLAVALSARRDAGAGIRRDHDRASARLGLLTGPVGLAARLERATVAWWTLALAAAGLLMGTVARSAGSSVGGSSVEQVLSRLGAPGTGAAAYLGVAFVMLGATIAFEAASLVGAAAAEEAEGRLDHLLARPVSRSSWLAGRAVLATGAVVAAGVAAGAFTWVGAAAQGAGLQAGTLLEAGVNAVPAALFLLGVGILGLGTWPRRATTVVYVVLAWSVLIEFVGGLSEQSHWVLDTSLFHQVTAAPAVSPDWTVDLVLVGLGLLAAGAGVGALRRRDLQVD